MIKKSFKNSLLVGASAFAMSAVFAAGQAEAAALAATGNAANTGNFTLDGDITLGEAVSDNTADGDELITLNSGSTLTTGAFTHARTGGTGTDADLLVTSANATSSTNVIVSSGGVLTSNDETGGSHVIDVNHTIGTITNLGKITSTATNGDLITLATGISANIVNGDDSSTAASITATGTGEAIVVEGTLTGSITNKAGALISGAASDAGLIDVDGAVTGTITNAGSVTVTGGGIAIDIGANVTGGVTNSGTISGATGDLVSVSGATTTDITNTGSITASAGGKGIDVAAKITGTITNGASGTTTSSISAAGGVGVELAADVTGGIVNWGTIEETSGKAIDVTAAVATGGIDNKSGATIKATTGEAIDIAANLVGNLTNAGTIQSAAGTAVITTGASDFDLTNTGTIQDTGDGIAVSITSGTMTGTLNNSGLITSAATTNTNDTINADAIISGGITNTGTISNTTATSGSAISVATGIDFNITNGNSTTAGTITTAGAQGTIDIEGETDGGITNTKGTISNTGTGNAITVSANGLTTAAGIISNAGTIETTNTASTADTILVSDMDGTFTNTGTIQSAATGTASAITITAFTGANLTSSNYINNSGLITAAGDTDTIDFGEANAAGNIVNSGTISNTGTGAVLELSGETGHALTIVNSGNITAANATTAAIVGGGAADTLNWNGGTITGTIDLGQETGDTINVGDAAADSITTGGAISNLSHLNVNNGTFNIAHAITLFNATEADENFVVGSSATAKFTDSKTVNAGDIDVNGTLGVAVGKTATLGTDDTNSTLNVNGGGTISLDLSAFDGTTQPTTTMGYVDHATNGTNTLAFAAGTGVTLNVTGASSFIKAGTITDAILSDTITIGGVTLEGNESSLSCSDNVYAISCSINAAGSDGDEIAITIARTGYQNSTSSVNGSAVGTALETIGTTSNTGITSIQAALDGMTSARQVELALETLDPEMSGAINAAAVSAAEAGFGVVGNRLDQLAGISGTGVAAGGMSYNHGVWGEVFGTAADQGLRDGVRGYQAETVGFGIGADTELSEETKVGASFAYASTDADSANGNTDIDSYQFSAYGTRDYGKWYADALAGFTFNKFDTTRNIVVGAVSNQANGDFDGQQYTLKVGGGYKLDVDGGLNVTPVASLKYNYLKLDDYTETGVGALNVDNDDIHSLKSDIGVKLNYPIVDGSMTYIPEISTSWSYDFIGDEQEATNNFVGAASTLFTTKGADVAQHQFNVGLGLDVLAQDNVTVSFDYDWASKEDYNSHSGAVKARFAF
jgi:uncharacterized protein with beta-barrel porin domain